MKRSFNKLLAIFMAMLMIVLALPMNVVFASVEIPDLLDSDSAYVSVFSLTENDDTESGFSISTGNEPWDEDSEPGNDSCATNNVVRTFDSVTYETYYETALFSSTVENGIFGYKEGTICFEYILPCTSEEAIFDVGSMGWLATNKQITYEIADVEIDGQPCQVLRGSFLLSPNSSNPSAIGASYNTTNIAVRILDMQNGLAFQPIFTMWLGESEVGTTYKGKVPGKSGGIPETIVYNSDYICPEHQNHEYSSFVAPPVLISAAPSYNVQLLKATHNNNTTLGTFDFSTGNDLASNKDAGLVNGRMYGYGLTLQIMSKSASKGMMGVEMPDGSDITFDLKLQTSFTKPNGKVIDSNVIDEGYRALLWSGDGNMAGAENRDGRQNLTVNTQILNSAPYNEDTDGNYVLNNDYNKCKNGGTWTFVADEEDPTVIHVTVSGYETDMKALPYTNAGSTSYTYYNPKTVGSQYWKVQTACISAGKVWVVQPYYNADGIHIKDYYGSGTCKTSLEDYDLVMTGTSGRSTEEFGQAKTTDDIGVFDFIYQRPGSEGTAVRYTRKNSTTALTTDCANSNADWAVSGQTISLNVVTSSNGSEGTKAAVAMSNMVKFDDTFFEPQSIANFSATTPGVIPSFKTPIRNIYWGAKPDKTGWDHKGLRPDEKGYDDDMLSYTSDDLVWFSSLSELKESGYVPVACYFEQIGLTTTANGANNSIAPIVTGVIKDECAVNYAYMLTCESYIWNKEDVSEYAADYFNATVPSLTDEQYDSFVKSENFYTRGDNASLNDFEIQPHYAFNSKTNSNFFKSIKAVYVDGVYTDGSNAPYYIDSCYVIPFKTKITKSVAQTNEDANKTTKKIYDLGQNQRIVDFVLNPSVVAQPGEGDSALDPVKTTVVITDTLPAGLTYIIGSSLYDKTGDKTYTQGRDWQTKGTVDGAEKFLPSVTVNGDGTTTLKWVLKDVVVDPNVDVTDLGLIYFSASIGTPLNEETDVVNQQQLVNTVTIHSDKDINCEYSEENGNYAIAAIEVLKQSGVSLVKQADSDTIDKGQPIGYTMYIGNNNAKSINNAIIVDNLPYNGDSHGSQFTGEVYVTKFAALTNDPAFYSSFDYYYTTDKSHRDMSGIDYINAGFTTEDFAKDPSWIKLNVSADNQQDSLFTNLPSASNQKGDNQIVSIVAVGDLKALQTLKFRVEINVPEILTNERLVNTLSRGRLVSESTVVVVSRTLTGTVWIDENANEVHDSHEEKLDDVTVTLLVKNENGEYVPYKYTDIDGNVIDAVISTGKTIDMVTGEITDNETGKYTFENLPEGTYSVVFNGEQTITDIEMPDAKSLKGSEQFVSVNNLGITRTSVTMTKTWDDQDDLDKLRGEYGVTLYANGEPASEEVILAADELTYTWTGLPISKNGELIDYTVVETTVPEGYTPSYNGYDIVNTHTPPKKYLPVVFFAPDNISFYLAEGITYYESPRGERPHVSTGGFVDGFHDSTTIYVERGTVIKFTNKTYFASYTDEYLTAVKSGENELTALPITIEADDEGYFSFRVTDDYYFVTMVQGVTNPDTDETKPWYQFLIDLLNKIKEFFAKLFG